MSELQRLCAKLCRELAQSERSAVLHTRREARRLGDVPPARALLSIGAHAEQQRARFDGLLVKRDVQSTVLARLVGDLFWSLRHAIFDRLVESERSYRGTLLGLRHGIDVARLLREVALREGDARLMRFCDEWLVERLCLLETAEQELAWFAETPDRALRPTFEIALPDAPP